MKRILSLSRQKNAAPQLFGAANLITLFRMVCSIEMLFVRAFSVEFYGLYLVAGISDMLDGFVARKTKTTSEFGAKLDSIADVTMVMVCTFLILPRLQIPLWVWVWMGIIAGIKGINLISGIVLHKKIVLPHTLANKLTGLLLFLFPLFVGWVEAEYLALPLCAVASFAAIQEGYAIGKFAQKGS